MEINTDQREARRYETARDIAAAVAGGSLPSLRAAQAEFGVDSYPAHAEAEAKDIACFAVRLADALLDELGGKAAEGSK